jgi:hypothetical protein
MPPILKQFGPRNASDVPPPRIEMQETRQTRQAQQIVLQLTATGTKPATFLFPTYWEFPN